MALKPSNASYVANTTARNAGEAKGISKWNQTSLCCFFITSSCFCIYLIFSFVLLLLLVIPLISRTRLFYCRRWNLRRSRSKFVFCFVFYNECGIREDDVFSLGRRGNIYRATSFSGYRKPDPSSMIAASQFIFHLNSSNPSTRNSKISLLSFLNVFHISVLA